MRSINYFLHFAAMDNFGIDNSSLILGVKSFTYILLVATILSIALCCYLCYQVTTLLYKSAKNFKDSFKGLRRVDSMSKRSAWSVFSRVDKSK